MGLLILANASPAIFRTMEHAIIGIPIIAAFEAVLLLVLFRPRWNWAIKLTLLVLAANYVSLIVGGIALRFIHDAVDWAFSSVPLIDRAWPITIAMLVVALILSALIEWPFLHIGASAGHRRRRVTLAGVAAINLASWIGVSYYYIVVREAATIYTHWERDDDLGWVEGVLDGEIEDWWVYYRAPDRSIRRIRLDGTGDEVFTGVEDVEYPVLMGWYEDTFRFRLDGASPDRFGEPHPIEESEYYYGSTLEPEEWSYEHFVLTADYRDPQESQVGVWHGGDYGEGLTVRDSGGTSTMFFTNPLYSYAFGTKEGAILPGNVAVLRLGGYMDATPDDFILIADIERRRFGVLAYGRQAVVAPSLSESSENEEETQENSPPGQ